MAKSFRAKASTTGDRHSCFPSPTAARLSSILSLSLSLVSLALFGLLHTRTYITYTPASPPLSLEHFLFGRRSSGCVVIFTCISNWTSQAAIVRVILAPDPLDSGPNFELESEYYSFQLCVAQIINKTIACVRMLTSNIFVYLLFFLARKRFQRSGKNWNLCLECYFK